MGNFVHKLSRIETDIAVRCPRFKETYFLPAFLLCEKFLSKTLRKIFPSLFTVSVSKKII